jgi:arylsulfatase A-like enzyme
MSEAGCSAAGSELPSLLIRPHAERTARLVGALLLVLATACAPPVAPRPRLVILYATCTLNRGFLSPYNPDVQLTPSLGRFAEQAVVFHRHHTEAGLSGIAFASLFSGAHAPTHGVYAHPKKLPDSLTLITEAFKADGYDVYSWARHPMASSDLNYTQGAKPAKNRKLLKGQDRRFQRILERLRKNPDYRAMIVTSFTLTHSPYGQSLRKMPAGERIRKFCERMPGECPALGTEELQRYRRLYQHDAFGFSWTFDQAVEREGLDEEQVEDLVASVETLYKMEIQRLDKVFGSVVSAIEGHRLMDQSLIAFTADHGENMHGEHAFFSWSHAYQQTLEVVNVPLIVRGPGLEPRRYEAVTRSIDVFPTLAGLSSVPIPENALVQGEDLSQALLTGRDREGLLAFSHTGVLPHTVAQGRLPKVASFKPFFPRRDPELMWVAVRHGDLFYKLRRLDDSGFRSFVFDLSTDPAESTNLFDPGDSEQQAMFERLEKYRERLIAGYAPNLKGDVTEQEETDLLRSLGYIE